MSDKIEIGKRLKALRRKRHYSKRYVAENLNISQAAYSLIENSQKGIISDHVICLSNLYDVTTDFILKGESMLVRISPTQGFLPYGKETSQVGFVKNLLEQQNIMTTEWDKILGYNSTMDYMLFKVEGDSMIPTIFPGNILICQIQNIWESILNGSLVLMITKDSLLLKRVQVGKDQEFFLLENDNPENREVMEFKKENILDIYMVRGEIYNLMVPYLQLLNKKRLENLEDSIEFLKKEVFEINKKINSWKI